jgi:4-amino-4-deoxy-L-arabinose transferase-like glycosyltransferase
MSHKTKTPLLYLCAIYLFLGTLYATQTPRWQAPDEPAHYNYIRYLAEQGRFPELTAGCYDQAYLQELTSRRFPSELPIDPLCYEFHQPPLYYLLAVPLFVVGGGALLPLRLFSVLLGGGVVVLAFLIGRAVCPERAVIAYGVAAFVAFIPMHLAILGSVNNDALAGLIIAGLLWHLIVLLSREGGAATSRRESLRLGGLLGLGLLTKVTVYSLIPLVAVPFVLAAYAGGRASWGRLFKQLAVVYGLAVLLVLPWYLRNAALYGGFDILGLGRHEEIVVGQLRAADYLAEVGLRTYLQNFVTTTFHSFWGQFGWMAVPMDGRVYLLLALLTVTALGGLYAALGEEAPNRTGAFLLFGLAVGLVAAAYGWYNLNFVQFQGRYLFGGIIPLGLLFTLGLRSALDERRAKWLAGWLGVVLVWAVLSQDKWAMLISSLPFILAVVRIRLARAWPSSDWLLVGCYVGLGLLALVGPFWFLRYL